MTPYHLENSQIRSSQVNYDCKHSLVFFKILFLQYLKKNLIKKLVTTYAFTSV